MDIMTIDLFNSRIVDLMAFIKSKLDSARGSNLMKIYLSLYE